MRWRAPEIDDERVRSWFAFFPVFIGSERRWLERVVVRQRREAIPSPHGFVHSWENIAFAAVDDVPA